MSATVVHGWQGVPIDLVRAHLSDTNPTIRAAGFELASRLKKDEIVPVVPYLLAAVGDGRPSFNVAWALIAPAQVYRPLMVRLSADKADNEVIYILQALYACILKLPPSEQDALEVRDNDVKKVEDLLFHKTARIRLHAARLLSTKPFAIRVKNAGRTLSWWLTDSDNGQLWFGHAHAVFLAMGDRACADLRRCLTHPEHIAQEANFVEGNVTPRAAIVAARAAQILCSVPSVAGQLLEDLINAAGKAAPENQRPFCNAIASAEWVDETHKRAVAALLPSLNGSNAEGIVNRFFDLKEPSISILLPYLGGRRELAQIILNALFTYGSANPSSILSAYQALLLGIESEDLLVTARSAHILALLGTQPEINLEEVTDALKRQTARIEAHGNSVLLAFHLLSLRALEQRNPQLMHGLANPNWLQGLEKQV